MLAIDLFCGLGGWTEGFLAEGYDVVGFDLERHDYGKGAYPAQLVIQDVRTLHGKQFRRAAAIVASPPCQAYSYRAMPWSRAKALPPPDNELFEACFRIQREASEAAGKHVPLVVENVRGAQKWVGRAAWHFGSYYLWGDVPALMPVTLSAVKCGGRGIGQVPLTQATDFFHTPHEKRAESAASKNGDGQKLPAGNCAPRRWEDREVSRLRDASGTKQGGEWWHDPNSLTRKTWGTSPARKAASAEIAKIPFALSRHIAQCFKVQ